MNRRWVALACVPLVALAGAAATWARADAKAESVVPTATVQRGRIDVSVQVIGDLRASRTVQLFAPAMGGSLMVVALAESGRAVREGDVIVEFDAAEQQFALEQAEFDLELASQEIAKAEAEAAARAAEDDVALLEARFAVRRAELDASANELVGSLVARQNELLLEEARGRLSTLESEVRSHGETTVASTDVLREKRNKAQLAVSVARRNIESLRLRASFDGFVTIRPNTMAFGGVIFSAAALPDFRVGDAANPGQLIAEHVDTAGVEVAAKLREQDRASVRAGAAVRIVVDARPDIDLLHGTVRAVSSVASRQLFDAGTRRFDISVDIDDRDVPAPPGVSAALTITGPTFDQALNVPRAAIFTLAGKPSLYVRSGEGFEPHEVTVRALTESVAVIEGVPEGSVIALVDPSGATSPEAPQAAPAVPARASR